MRRRDTDAPTATKRRFPMIRRRRGARRASLLAVACLVASVGVAGGSPTAHAATTDHVQAFGGAAHAGSLDTLRAGGIAVSDATPVALLATPSGAGYWIVLADGNVYSFGDAAFFGSLSSLRDGGTAIDPAVVVVAAARTPSGRGYWLADGNGGVYSFGDARFAGSIPGLRAAGLVGAVRIVAMDATPSGAGYWLADERGGVFTFGDARFAGSIPALQAAGVVGAVRLVAIEATPSGAGYWLVDDRGGVFTFGDAPFFGAPAAEGPSEPVAGFAATVAGDGYRVLTSEGRVRSYGAAPDHGSAAVGFDVGAVALTAAPGTGYWVVTPQVRAQSGAPPLPSNSGAGRRIVYSNSLQRVWLVEASGVVSRSWPVSGRRGVPAPGNYHIFSKSPVSSAGSLRLDHMVRFARGQRLAIGFHAIPTSNGRPIQGLDELGQYRSHGCVRQDPRDAAHLYQWAPVGTAVVVTP